jgi:pre-mRNA-processing factor 19
MSLICSLSGQEAEEAVVSRATGHVYERRLIEKYLAANDRRCPITGQTLDADDLLELKVSRSVRPRPATGTSIPSMLQLFQNEWDAAMLECYSLKQQLNLARQQLAHALYQQDAACRVIARLTRERDEARRALSTAQAHVQPSAGSSTGHTEGMDVEGGAGISEQIKQRLITVSKQLTSERKKRTVPKETASEEQIKSLRLTSSHPTHSSSKPGILCLDLHPNQKLVATGGVDRNVVVLNRESGVAAPALTGHTKRVNCVAFHPERDALLSASHDGTVRLWTAPEGEEENGIPRYASAAQLQPHSGAEVVSVSLHPTGDFFASASLNGSWAFSDLSSHRTLASVPAPVEEAIHAASFHPDGLIYGTGTSTSKVRVWDMKTLGNVATFDGHTAPVRAMAFSENGFYMASAADDHTVRLWDLRKLKSFQTLTLPESDLASVAFDYSGKYLAVGGSDIRVYGFAGRLVESLCVLNDHSAQVTGVLFGRHAHLLASTSLDRTLKFFQPTA